MKGIVNVSIAGIAFKLEDEAYSRLDAYLGKIRNSYEGTVEGDEIISDLEARIAEIILTQQDASVVVPLSLIEGAIERLGAPEDISEGAAPGGKEKEKTEGAASTSERRIPHRLYRNPEGAKFGGVCSGLGAYFDIDPALVRIIFAAPLVLMIFFYIIGWSSWGNTMVAFMTTAFILYFLLWIVIPKAKTPLQKLEMRGEPITKSTIEQTFREEFQSRSNDPQNIQMRAKSEKNASIFADFLSIIGNILLFCAKALVAVIGFAFIMAIVGIIVALGYVMLEGSAAVGGFTATSPVLIVVLVCLAVMIPLGLAVYGILKMLFGFHHNRPLVTTLLVIWVLTLAFGTVIFIKDFDNIRFNDGIYVRMGERSRDRGSREVFYYEDERNWHTETGTFALAADTLYVVQDYFPAEDLKDNMTLKIRQGNSTFVEPTVQVKKTHKGYDGEDNQYVDVLDVSWVIRNDTLVLTPRVLGISGVDDETVELEVFLPQAREVRVAPGINYNEYFDSSDR